MIVNSNGANGSRSSIQQIKRDQSDGHINLDLMIEPGSVRFFTGLEKSEIRADFGHCDSTKIERRRDRGQSGRARVPFISRKRWVHGLFRLTSDGREILLRRLVSGNIFGVAAFLSDPVGYIGTSKAVHSSEVFVWEHAVIRQLAKEYPELGENAFRTVLRYIALFAERHIALVSKPAQERLAFALTSLGSRAGHMVPSGVEINIKNEDLASLADVSFFTASRFLQEWERKGALEKSRGKVLIRSPEKLLA